MTTPTPALRPLVVVDTNILFGDLELAHANAQRLLGACGKGHIDLAVPEVVVLECVRHFRRRAPQDQRDAVKARLALRRLGFTGLPDQEQIEQVVNQRVEGYEATMRSTLADAGARILPLPAVSHEDLLARLLAEQKPFKAGASDGKAAGDGYRDALIWASIVELCSSRAPGTLILVTDNYKDFGVTKESRQLHEALHADLDPAWSTSRLAGLEELFAVPEIEAAVQADLDGVSALPSEEDVAELLAEPIEQAATALCYTSITDPAFSEQPGDGAAFKSLALPWGRVEALEIDTVDPDPSTLGHRILDAFDEFVILEARIEAELVFEGYVTKGDAVALDGDDDLDVVEFDWNNHLSRVQLRRTAVLVFTANLRPEDREVFDVQFGYAVPVIGRAAAHAANGASDAAR